METLDIGIDGLDDIEEIGRGGSSRVYRAKQVELDRLVALKVLKSGDDPDVARRFDRERKAMGRLSLNDGIVPVYSSGVNDHGEPYLIMPYYPNGSLQDRLERGRVPWEEAVGYIAVAAQTMAAAHEAGVVHLDLKPANILLSNDSPKIADFGIAKLMSDQTPAADTGPAFTPTFSAPETLLGGATTPASDVYGLSATLWALIAGRAPFKAEAGEDNTLMAVVGRVVHQPAGDLRDRAPDQVCSVIETGMSKDPADRYSTAGSFARALAAAVDHLNSTGPTSAAMAAAAAVAPDPGPPVAGPAVAGLGDADPTITNPAQPEPNPYGNGNGTGSGSRLIPDEPVPPRLVPATEVRSGGLADIADRYSGVLLTLLAAAAVVVVFLAGQRLLNQSDESTDTTTQLVQTESTTSTALNASAGAGGSDVDRPSTTIASEPEGPETSQAATTTAAPTTTIPATTSTETTGTTVATSETTDTTVATSETTESTVPTSETTATTDPTTSTTSTTTTTTTTTTTSIPIQLGRPQDVDATLRGNGSVRVTWDPPDDEDGLTGYFVYRSDGVAQVLLTSPRLGPNTEQFIDPGGDLLPDTTYAYTVVALGPPDGDPANSAPSAPDEITTPPEAP